MNKEYIDYVYHGKVEFIGLHNRYLEDLASDRATLEYNSDRTKEEGMMEWRKEENLKHKIQQIELVKKMLANGLTIEKASMYSGLSVDDIKNIK